MTKTTHAVRPLCCGETLRQVSRELAQALRGTMAGVRGQTDKETQSRPEVGVAAFTSANEDGERQKCLFLYQRTQWLHSYLTISTQVDTVKTKLVRTNCPLTEHISFTESHRTLLPPDVISIIQQQFTH